MRTNFAGSFTGPTMVQSMLAAATVTTPMASLAYQNDHSYAVLLNADPVLNQSSAYFIYMGSDMKPAWVPTGGSLLPANDPDGPSIVNNWADDAVRPPEWAAAFKRLDDASAFEDGWNGPDSLAGDPGAIMGARALLTELEGILSADTAPKIGLDSDGLPLLSWHQGDLVGSLSVLDTDSYAYYIERGDDRTACEEAKLSRPLPADLVRFLTD